MILKRLNTLAAIAAFALAFSLPATAQLKVAVVDLQKALQQTAEIKQAEADLKARFGPRQEEVATLEKEIARLQQDAQQGQGKYTEAAMAEIVAQLQNKQRQYQRNAQALQEDVNRDRQDLLSRIGERLSGVVKSIAEAKDLDLVVDVSSALYVKPAIDISAEVAAEYDKKFPAKP
jgi:outer membrane protein